MKKILVTLLMVLSSVTSLADISIKNVTAQQRYPWNGKVDVVVTLEGPSNDLIWAECTFAATNVDTKEALSVSHIAPVGSDSGFGTVWERRFLWDASTDIGAAKINEVAFTVDITWSGGVQLWENGPYWAECNVGATKPEEYGYYFWWGDTVGYKRNSNNSGWVSVKTGSSFKFYDSNCPTFGKNNSTLQSLGYIDSTGNLVAAHDAATSYLGEPWRMPTDAEFSALVNSCTATWTTNNGVSGMLVKGKGGYSSKSIFFPAAGYGDMSGLIDSSTEGHYWTSVPYSWTTLSGSEHCESALNHGFDSRYFYYSSGIYDRSFGHPVRPIRVITQESCADSGQCIACARLEFDGRTGRRETLATGVSLYYDASWYEKAETIVIYANETEIHSGVKGEIQWVPSTCGEYTLQLKALANDGSVVGMETAEFVSNHIEVVTTEAKSATCTELGCTKGSYCSHCNAILSVSESIHALGHDEVVITSAKTATCTEEGCTKGSYCSRCNAILSVSETIPALGHQEVVTTAAKTATCTETGCTKGSYCSRCSKTLSVSEALPALGHEEVVTQSAVAPIGANPGYTAEIKCSRCGITLQERTAVWTPGTVIVTNVTAQQRYPWNGKVDIVVTIQGDVGRIANYKCTFVATNSATQMPVPVTAITQTGNDVVSGDICARRYLWDSTNDVGVVKIDDLALTVDLKELGGVQLWENGPYWAECNVGALKPEEYGYYFWWGDTIGYIRNIKEDGWMSVGDGSAFTFKNCLTSGENNSKLENLGYIDAFGNLTATHDAATTHLGAPWRMPTSAEFLTLTNKCDMLWTTRNGVYGQLVTGRGAYASKSVFFPAAGFGEQLDLFSSDWYGYYWSSTSIKGYSYYFATMFYFDAKIARPDGYYRSFGMPVRPLRSSVE